MTVEAAHSVIIPAPPRECYDAICEFESYPQWQKVIHRVVVRTRHKDGRPRIVEYRVNLMIREVRYVLDYRYHDDIPRLSWTYVEGDIKDVIGYYDFQAVETDKTKATYYLKLELGLYVPGALLSFLNDQVMKGSVIALKHRVMDLQRARI